MPKKILVAFDGSEPSKRAFRFALELAQPFRAQVSVVSVAQPPEPPSMVESSAMREAATDQFVAEFEWMRSQADAMGVEVATHVAFGHPAEQIVKQADERESDLIVMGHRGKSRIQEWLLGSVSKRVLSYAACSVTIVR